MPRHLKQSQQRYSVGEELAPSESGTESHSETKDNSKSLDLAGELATHNPPLKRRRLRRHSERIERSLEENETRTQPSGRTVKRQRLRGLSKELRSLQLWSHWSEEKKDEAEEKNLNSGLQQEAEEAQKPNDDSSTKCDTAARKEDKRRWASLKDGAEKNDTSSNEHLPLPEVVQTKPKSVESKDKHRQEKKKKRDPKSKGEGREQQKREVRDEVKAADSREKDRKRGLKRKDRENTTASAESTSSHPSKNQPKELESAAAALLSLTGEEKGTVVFVNT